MKADADFKGGWYDPQRPPTVGPRAFARVYAGWGFSQAFYWEKVCPLALLICSVTDCCAVSAALVTGAVCLSGSVDCPRKACCIIKLCMISLSIVVHHDYLLSTYSHT